MINQVRPISVAFVLPAEALPDIRRGMATGALRVIVRGRPDARPLGEGTRDLVHNQIDQATGTLRLKATLANADGALWPGLFVTVQLVLRVERGVRTVPSTAIQRGVDSPWLYVVQPDAASRCGAWCLIAYLSRLQTAMTRPKTIRAPSGSRPAWRTETHDTPR